MPNCHTMKVGEVYWCPKCGFEIKVIAECKTDHGHDTGDCACDDNNFECCGEPLKKRK